MQRDGRSIAGDSVLEADLCILGGGAAGITLARSFAGRREKVVLLESGGLDFDARTQSLYDGEAEGTVFSPSNRYLTRSRLRYFGGSTNHWEGLCRPLDAEDFLVRDWVPGSGWPIDAATLAPFYEEAGAICELEALSNEADTSELTRGVRGLRSIVLRTSPPTRFGEVYRDTLLRSDNVTVTLFANAVELETNDAASVVTSVRARTLEGNTFTVHARRFVLACGGIENARLLLASSRARPGGLGNDHDLVGRYFMEHPHVAAGALCLVPSDRARSLDELLGSSARALVSIGLDPSLKREHRLLNCAVEPRPITRERNIDPTMRDVASLTAAMDRGAWSEGGYEAIYANLLVRAEQAPNPESRVRLSDARDPLGRPRARLDWRLSEDDRTSIERSLELIGRSLGEAGGGRVFIEPVLEASWPRTYGGSHHMGTTRMDGDPRKGVVDASCRVHGIANLHVAGSSVFPTCGFANPTLTIVALALRLAEHLKREGEG